MKEDMMDLTTGDMVIFSGEGTVGTWERYYGSRTPKAIRSKLSRERSGGDRWASIWIEAPELDAEAGETVYGCLSASLDEVENYRAVPRYLIMNNPAAEMAASKRGRSAASAANGRLGGRPRYVVRHYFRNPANNSESRCSSLIDAKEELLQPVSDEKGGCSKLYKNDAVIGWREHNESRIHWR